MTQTQAHPLTTLQELSRFRFAGRSEQAVREEWIRPLLVHLGYGVETLHEVRYEERLNLARPLRRIGRQRVEVDYVPTVWGRGLWIIEAEAHQTDDWDDAISQAWLYATHPEVDVPFMAIADGSRIVGYDVYKPNWDEPVVEVPTTRLVADFARLAAVFGAANVTRAVRTRRMRHLGLAMKAELSLARLDEYVSDLKKLAADARGSVIENQRAVRAMHDQATSDRRATALQGVGLFAVGVWMNQPLAISVQTASAGVEHVRSLHPSKRGVELDRLVAPAVYKEGQVRQRRPSDVLDAARRSALFIYLKIRDEAGCEAARGLARRAIRDHILNFPEDPLARAAHRVERVLPVFVLRTLLGHAQLNLPY